VFDVKLAGKFSDKDISGMNSKIFKTPGPLISVKNKKGKTKTYQTNRYVIRSRSKAAKKNYKNSPIKEYNRLKKKAWESATAVEKKGFDKMPVKRGARGTLTDDEGILACEGVCNVIKKRKLKFYYKSFETVFKLQREAESELSELLSES
jgi:hypothetical protein